MQALKVYVKNGRLVVDQPTDLPDGAEVEIVVIDDKLTADERAELLRTLVLVGTSREQAPKLAARSSRQIPSWPRSRAGTGRSTSCARLRVVRT